VLAVYWFCVVLILYRGNWWWVLVLDLLDWVWFCCFLCGSCEDWVGCFVGVGIWGGVIFGGCCLCYFFVFVLVSFWRFCFYVSLLFFVGFDVVFCGLEGFFGLLVSVGCYFVWFCVLCVVIACVGLLDIVYECVYVCCLFMFFLSESRLGG